MTELLNNTNNDFIRTNDSNANNNVHSPWHDFDHDCKINRGPMIPFAYANNPAPGQWDGRILSPSRVAGYRPFTVVDGEGVRCSVYTAFCPFNCKDCFSPLIQKKDVGFEYTQDFEDTVIKDLSHSYVQGLTLLGGEPMLNTPMLIKLCKRVRDEFGNDKDIWSWTGYTWEELHREGETPDKLELLSYVDILVDGRFMYNLKNPMLQFRGSSNQRIIDVKKTNEEGRIHIWDKIQDQTENYVEYNEKDRMKGEGVES